MPRYTPENFRAFFSAEGWGSLRQTRKGKTHRSAIKVEAGRVVVRGLYMRAAAGTAPRRVRVAINGRIVPSSAAAGAAQNVVWVILSAPAILDARSKLAVTFT